MCRLIRLTTENDLCEVICTYQWRELVWRSGSVMDCHVTALGSTPGGNGVFTELHVICKGQ